MKAHVRNPGEELTAFCRRNRIVRLAPFGAVLRNDFTPGSDEDVLVESAPDARIGLSFVKVQEVLSEGLGRLVDLRTFQGVESNRNWPLREEILGSAEAVCDKTG